MLRTGILAAVTALAVLQNCTLSFGGGVTVETSGAEDAVQVSVENDWVSIVIDPTNGGRISSYFWKASGSEWAAGEGSGMLMDHVTQQKWPGELMDRLYGYKILDVGPEVARVRLWTTIIDELDETIRDVKLTKTLTVRADSPVLDASYRLENPTDDTKTPTLWIQNIVAPGGYAEAKFSFRPTTLGPLAAKWGKNSGRVGRFDDDISFRLDPTGGWLAQLHSPTKQGLVFLVDYNWLKCLYCCNEAMTSEWWYERSILMPGKAFETSCQVLPVFGLESVAHASRRFVAELDILREGQAIRVANRLVAGPEEIANIEVKVELIDYLSQNILSCRTVGLEALGKEPQVQLLQCDKVVESTDVVARVTVSGDGFSEQYERFDCGAAIIGTETRYRLTRPARDRPIFKPEKIVKTRNAAPRILHLRGLFQHYYRWPEIKDVLGGELRTGSYTVSVFGPSLSYFPTTYDELMSYDVIVLNNLAFDSFGEEHLEYLDDFAEYGGVILVIGGPTSFGAGGYQNSRLEKFLPVRAGGAFDMGRHDSPLPLDATDAEVGYFQYFQTVAEQKPDASVLEGEKDRPIVIARRQNQGVVAFFSPLVLGSMDVVPGFWEAANYPKWMAGVVLELLQMTETYDIHK